MNPVLVLLLVLVLDLLVNSGGRGRGRGRERNEPVRLLFTTLLLSLLLGTGCSVLQPAQRALGSAYHPHNVFAWSPTLPPNIRRVALLPLACDETSPEIAQGRCALEPILREELIKARQFEVTPIDRDGLRNRTGQAAWNCAETLPPDLISWLAESSGCDAVFFCQLTVFRGYAPLAVGWRMRLVDVRTHNTLWAADEVFDSQRLDVQVGARRHQLAGRRNCQPAPDEWVIENSPRQFGQYAAAELLAGMPGL